MSNELGAGNPKGARVAVKAIMALAVVETTIVSSTVFASRNVFGYIFTNEKEVVDYVTKMAPLLCLNIIMDSLQGTLSGSTSTPFSLSLIYHVCENEGVLLMLMTWQVLLGVWGGSI